MDFAGGSSGNPTQLKDQACAQVYFSRMMKLQSKLQDQGAFEFTNGESFVPQQFIDVGWGGKDSENVALFGNTLPLSRTWEKPNVIFESSEGTYYSVVAFDADSREEVSMQQQQQQQQQQQSSSCYLLWARLNVTGDTQYSSGRDLVRWQPPHPKDKDRPHRIFVFVFHQPHGESDVVQSSSSIVSKNSREGRSGFSLVDFMKAHRLGHIIGANCWKVGFDAQVVPKIVAELRDRVVLDSTGKKVLREELNGEVVYEAAKSSATTSSETQLQQAPPPPPL